MSKTPQPAPLPIDLLTLRAMGELMMEEADDDPRSLRGLRARLVLQAADEIERLRNRKDKSNA